MRYSISVVALISVLGAVVAAQSSSARHEVIAAQRHFYTTYQACDAKELETLVTDDMMYLHSTGQLQKSKADLVKGLDSSKCAFEILRVDPTSVRVYGDTAVIFGNLHFKTKTGSETMGQQMASQVFVKRNGRWLFASNVSMEPVPLDTSVRLAAQTKEKK